MSLLDPHQTRLAARSLKYDNSADETANLERVDHEVFGRVARFEQGVVDTARAHADKGDRLAQQAITLTAELRTRFRNASGPGEISREALREFSRLRTQAEALANSLEVAERAAQWHTGRLADVYGSWLALVQKYPTLRPGIPIQ